MCVVAAIAAVFISPSVAAIILVLPLVAAAGALLSALALREINRSAGTVVGKPIAIVGLLVGIVSAILQGAAGLSAAGSMLSIRSNLVPVVETFVLAHERGDRSSMRACLGETVSRHLDDARIDRFFAETRARLGAPKGARFDFGVMLRAGERTRGASAGVAPGATVIENPRPVELVFDSESAIAFVVPDEEAMRASNRVAIADVLVMLPDDSVLTLRDDGPMEALARRLGWRVVE